MKKFLSTLAVLLATVAATAQSVDTFQVGPYTVDYYDSGDVKYRLRNNINLYEYFSLEKDTIVVVPQTETLVNHAIQISGFVEAGPTRSPKGIGVEALWKQGLGEKFFLNAGLSLNVAPSVFSPYTLKRCMLEVAIPVQFEVGRICREHPTLYGAIGIAPTLYTTILAEQCAIDKYGSISVVDGDKNTGLLVTPSLELGANIPIAGTILRMGVYSRYKVNLNKAGNIDFYNTQCGRAFLGVKIGVVL